MDNSELPLAFILMPFDEIYSSIYDEFIKPTLSEQNYRVLRADDIQSQKNIMFDVIEYIVNADLIIADLTDNNPNVFYELGIAHTLNKKVILLTQEIEEIPFDLRAYRVIKYDTHFSKIKMAKNELSELARKAKSEGAFSNPVSDYSNNNIPIEASELPKGNNENVLDDDRGFIDHLIDFEDGMADHTKITEELTAIMKDISSKTKRANKEITKANQNGGQGSTRRIKKISRSLGQDLLEISSKIKEKNDSQHQILLSIEDSLEYVINFNEEVNEESKAELENLIENYSTFKESSKYAQESIADLVDSIHNNIGFERNLNKAFRKMEDELNRTLDNIRHIDSIFQRGTMAAEKKLNNI